MLELLATVDPMAALMGGLWLFAAGMFPVGFMLPCSPCCNSNRCDLCTEGELPETLTVTFDNLPDQTPGPDLISVSFSSCFGGGASARVTAPGGDPETDKGPISAISLTSGGSGYAKLGRVEPTLTAGGGSGSGVTLTPTLTQAQDSCKVDYWKVTAVSVSGGTGYADGDQVAFTVAEGDTEATAASATIHTTRNEPALTASASGGTGATFSISYTKNDGPPPTWSIDSISVTNGGSGYSGGSTLNISLGTDDVEVYGTYAYITTDRTQPTLSASVNGTGSGASLTVSLSSGYGDEYGPTWTVSSIGITNGGSGYSEWDQVTITVTDGQQSYWGYFDAYVTGIDENGAITAITIYYGGDYYKDVGVITGVNLYYGGGEYYKDDGVPTSVSVEGGGVYYREDTSEPPYVADVTVSLSQQWPSQGDGATITAEVEDNTSSPDFGKVKSLEITDGGNSYLAHELFDSCLSRFDGRSIVCKKTTSDPCLFRFACDMPACTAEEEVVTVRYKGPSSPLEVTLYARVRAFDWSVLSGGPTRPETKSASGLMLATENVPNCSDVDVTCEPASGLPPEASATVAGGGTYAETKTCLQLPLDKLEDVYVSVEWAGQSWDGPISANLCGSNAWFNWYFDSSPEAGKSWIMQNNHTALTIEGCSLSWWDAPITGQYMEQQASFPFRITKNCGWVYQMVDIPVDEDGFPSGPATVVRDLADPLNYGDCDYPGLPSISFSRLP